jgi:hypothetical protein
MVFHYKKTKNIIFVFKAIMVYYLRDISWVTGLIRGFAKGILGKVKK